MRGQAVIEFALVLPVMLLIVLGVVDVGRVFFDYVGLRNAAMEGAIYGTRNLSASETDAKAAIKQRVQHHFPSGEGPSTAEIEVDYAPSYADCTTTDDDASNPTVSVTITHEFRPITLDLLQFAGPGTNWAFTVNPTAQARCMT